MATPAQLTDQFRGYNDIALAGALSRHIGNMRGGGFAERDEPELRIIRDEITARGARPLEEADLRGAISTAIVAAQALAPSSGPAARCRSLIITKLEEAQHRALEYEDDRALDGRA